MNTKKEFKMNLLNAEEMKGLNGGAVCNCEKTGDTIWCAASVYKLCATYECSCPVSITTNSCETGITISCAEKFIKTCTSGHAASVTISAAAVVVPLSLSVSSSAPMVMSAMW